jgi:hypothetical protein
MLFERFVIIRWPVRNRQSAPEYSSKIKGLHASACNPFFFSLSCGTLLGHTKKTVQHYVLELFRQMKS